MAGLDHPSRPGPAPLRPKVDVTTDPQIEPPRAADPLLLNPPPTSHGNEAGRATRTEANDRKEQRPWTLSQPCPDWDSVVDARPRSGPSVNAQQLRHCTR